MSMRSPNSTWHEVCTFCRPYQGFRPMDLPHRPWACAVRTAHHAHMHEQVWWIGVADKKARFLPFIWLTKRFESKIGQFFATFDIVIALATRYGAYKSRSGRFLWTTTTTTTRPITLPPCACARGNNIILADPSNLVSMAVINEHCCGVHSKVRRV